MKTPDPSRDGRLRPAARAPREERTPLALARLLMRDERSWTVALALTVFWLIPPAFSVSVGASDTANAFAAVLAVLTAAGGLWVFGRLLRIRRLLLEGIRVDGTVVAITVHRNSDCPDTRSVTVDYSLGGQHHRLKVLESFSSCRVGEVVSVLADPRRPSWAILERMYANPRRPPAKKGAAEAW
jgi:hypothetical protein